MSNLLQICSLTNALRLLIEDSEKKNKDYNINKRYKEEMVVTKMCAKETCKKYTRYSKRAEKN